MIYKQIRQFQKILKIHHEIISISFSSSKPSLCKFYQDTACTALARSIIQKERIIFDEKNHIQLCEGANYFLKLKKITDREAMDVYVNNEHVFANCIICADFLRQLPKFPKKLIGKFIIISPLKKAENPQIIILLVNPAQAGRILGLLNYASYNSVEIYPNQPTCIALFAPLVTGKPHINFIDYYDRYYQGKIGEEYLWNDNELILSLKLDDFKKILKNFSKSPHGTFRPVSLNPQKIDGI